MRAARARRDAFRRNWTERARGPPRGLTNLIVSRRIMQANATPLKTLFLQAPSYDGFDGGAGSRYQAKREIR
ncbi:hypothetical protein, partial [Burkholderia gladioli]|uniref:hypothetical protein n=1 Tax=Burkholderia gladioli TaxID=28095 RepID=UPI003A5C58B4